MVYCTKCGTKNEDDATVCVECKQPLSGYQPVRHERRRKEDECFGLPHGGAIFGLFIGVLIIFAGLQQLYGWNVDVGPFAVIFFGLLIIAGALYGLTRRRS